MILENIELASLNVKKIRQLTDCDPVLSRVRLSLLQGWDNLTDEFLTPFQSKRDELSIQDGCVLRETRIVVPAKGRELVLDLLHQGHPGITRMKSIARSFVWWPGMDAQLEKKVMECERCQLTRHAPPKVPLHPWEWPPRPWGRIHIDYAGPYCGRMFLLAIDAHSKWLEVSVLNSATSATTIVELRKILPHMDCPRSLYLITARHFPVQSSRNL